MMAERIKRLTRQVLLGRVIWLVVGIGSVGCETSNQTQVAPMRLGSYDHNFEVTVAKRWHELIRTENYSSDNTGKVVVQFKQYADGRIGDVNILEATVPPSLANHCEKAICDSAPYPKWSREMRLAFRKDVRNVTFTFRYDAKGPDLEK